MPRVKMKKSYQQFGIFYWLTDNALACASAKKPIRKGLSSQARTENKVNSIKRETIGQIKQGDGKSTESF